MARKRKDDPEQWPLPEPMLVLDFSGERSAAAAPEVERRASQAVERKVVERVRAKCEMAFGRGQDAELLPQGTVVEVLDPTDAERSDLERLRRRTEQYVVIRWLGRVRLVPARDLDRALD